MKRFLKKLSHSLWVLVILPVFLVPVSLFANHLHQVGWDHTERLIYQVRSSLRSYFVEEHPFSVILYGCEYATIGNLFSGMNQIGSLSDRLRAGSESLPQISSISWGESNVGMPESGVAVLVFDIGTLTIFRNGFYTFILSELPFEEKSQLAGESRAFRNFLISGDHRGVRFSQELQLAIFDVEETNNPYSEYSRGTTNMKLGRSDWYQSVRGAGTMLIGIDHRNDYEAANFLGTKESDAIFTWKGNDSINGGSGHDLLTGEQGSNILKGGKGGDAFFIYSDKSEDGIVDTILDFSVQDNDVIIFSSVLSQMIGVDQYGKPRLLVSHSPDKIMISAFIYEAGKFVDVLDIKKSYAREFLGTSVYDWIESGHLQFPREYKSI